MKQLYVLFFCCIIQQLWSQTNQPNVILIVADDHGKDAIGCYGNPIIKTPHLDRLAATGTKFNRAFCTTASCSASRSVILTGLHNHFNGQYGHQHSYHHFSSFENIKSLPVLLEDQGYRTGHVGKYHVAPESVYRFQHRFQANARSPIEMAQVCEHFIKEDAGAPFFLYFCFSDPHRGGGFAEEIPHQPNRFGNTLSGYPMIEEVIYNPAEVLVPAFLPDNPETRAEIAQYYQSISRLDKGVGKLLDYLESSGKMDDTFIMYVSDNGMAFPGAKTTLYEGGMQLPCIVKMPGQTTSTETDEMFSWTDITPTIVDLAGGLTDDSLFHGSSFVPVLNGKAIDRDAVYASHTFHEITMYYPMRVVRGENYKLIVNLAHGLPYPFASDLYASKTWQSIEKHGLRTLGGKPVADYIYRPRLELYDIVDDPHEVHNLAQDPAFGAQLEGMVQKVKNFQAATNDPWIIKWKYE